MRFQDVDHAGIVFFAKLYEYCHIAYEDFVEEVLGLGPHDFFEVKQFGAPLVATRSEHVHPLYHGDKLIVEAHVSKLGRSSMTMAYIIKNQDGVTTCRVWMTHAFITRQGFKSMPIPDGIRADLTPYVFLENEP